MATPNPPFNGFYPPAIAPRPTQPPNTTSTAAPDKNGVALFIDWDNLVISNYADSGSARPDLDLLIRKAQEYGTLVVARAYAEWSVTADRLAVYNAGIDPAYAPVFHASNDLSGQTSRGKSLADPVMVTDCIDLLHTMPTIGTYILVTGDKDMVPVVRLAKLRGRRVIIIGPDFVANVLQQVSTEFYSYRQLQMQQFVQQYGYYPGYFPQQPGQPGQQVIAQPMPGYAQQPVQGQPMIIPPGYAPQPQPGQPVMQQPQQPQPTMQQPQPAGRGNQRRLNTRNGRTQSYAPPAQPYAQVQMPQSQQPAPQFGYGQPMYAPYPQPGYLPQQPGFMPQPIPYAPTELPQAAVRGVIPQPETQAGALQPEVIATPTQPGKPADTRAARPLAVDPLVALRAANAIPEIVVTPVVATPVTPVPVAPVENRTAERTPTPPAPVEKAPQPDLKQVREMVEWILATRAANGKLQVRARDLKEELLRKLPAFTERKLGFAKFKGLLNAIEQAGGIQLEQVAHILWVSLPGAPSLSEIEPAQLAETDIQEPDIDDEGDEDAATAVSNRAHESSPASISAPPAVTKAIQTPPVEAVPAFASTPAPEPAAALVGYPVHTPSVTGGIDEAAASSSTFTPADEYVAEPTNVAETATAVQESEARAARPRPVRSVSTEPRPALLEGQYIEETIRLVDTLRARNRWLGYDLLVASTRDMLLPHMLESEAKLAARDLVSRLLDEGVLKIEMEKHSRGPSRRTVKVLYLQENHPAAQYVLNRIADEKAGVVDNYAADGVVATETPDAFAPVTEAEFAQPEATSTEPVVTEQAIASLLADSAEPAFDASTTVEQHIEVPVAEAEAPHNEAALVAEVAQPDAEQPTEPEYVHAFYTTARVISLEELAAPPAVAPVTAEPEAENVADVVAAVEPTVATPEGLAPDTGEGVQGAPENAQEGGEPAPAGGYHDTGMTVEASVPAEAPFYGEEATTAATAPIEVSAPDVPPTDGASPEVVLDTTESDVAATGFAIDTQTDPSDVEATPEVEAVAVDADGKPVAKPRRPAYRRPRRPAAARTETEPAGGSEGGNSGNSPSMRLGYRFRQHHSDSTGRGETF